jgi:hypothetical protein
MRFVKLFAVLMVICSSFVLSYGQSTPANTTPEQDLSKTIHLWPNPAVEYVHVKVEQIPASKVKLKVHNIIGNEMDIETEIVDEHELRVRVKDLAAGYYLLAINDDESKFRKTFKFLKR